VEGTGNSLPGNLHQYKLQTAAGVTTGVTARVIVWESIKVSATKNIVNQRNISGIRPKINIRSAKKDIGKITERWIS